MKVTISIDTGLLRKLDVYCKEYGFGRSELLSLLVRRQILKFEFQEYDKVEKTLNKELPIEQRISGEDETHDKDGYLYAGNPIDFEEMRMIKHWCELNVAHPFKEAVKMDTFCVTFEDMEGVPRTRGKKLLSNVYGCMDCIESLRGSFSDGAVLTGEVSI